MRGVDDNAINAGVGKPAHESVERLVGALGRTRSVLHVGGADGNASVKGFRNGAPPLDEV